MEKEKRYNYIRKKTAKGTAASAGCGALSLILLCLTVGLAVYYQGSGPAVLGALGFSSIVMAVFGMVFSLSAEADRSANRLLSRMAGGSSAVLLLIWCFLALAGIR